MTQIYLPNIPGLSAEEPYQSAIRKFLLYLYQNGLSTRTISSYGWHLNKFGIWLINRQVLSVNELTPEIIIEWGAHLRSKYGDQARKLSVVATKRFVQFLVVIRECRPDIAEDIHKFLSAPTVRVTPQRTLSEEEVNALFGAVQGNSPRKIRDAAIIALLLDSGLRATEFCQIKCANLDLETQSINIIGKGGNKEIVYYGVACQLYFTKWLDVRKSIKTNHDYLFVSLGGITPGKALTPRGLRSIIKQLGEKAGITGVHPYAFRRAFATIRIRNGQSIRGVQNLGRWKNFSTFERYTQALMFDREFARRQANQYSPLNNIKRNP